MENELHTPNAGQGMGIAALVLGIVAAIAAFIPCFGFIAILFGVLAIIFGAIALSQAKKGNASTTMPKAGLILGIVATAFVIIWMLVIVGTIGSAVATHSDEIKRAIDSANTEAAKTQDSVNEETETVTDTTITVEETQK